MAVLLPVLMSCASTPLSTAVLSADPARFSQAVNLEHVPFFPQELYQCGPAALATVLANTGVDVDDEALVPLVYVPARQGSLQPEMLAAARQFERLPLLLDPDLASVLDEVQAGRPVLVMQNLGLGFYPQWHYAVVVGFDLDRRELILRSGTVREYRVSLRLFERTWARADHWAFVVLEPGQLPLSADVVDYVEAVDAFARINSHPAVLTAFEAGRQRWADEPLLLMALANAQYAAGEVAEAAQTLDTLLHGHQDHAVAHNNLANMLLELGDPARAETHARRAVALGGEHAAAFNNTLQRVLGATRQ